MMLAITLILVHLIVLTQTVSSGIVERHGGTIGVSSSGVNGEGCVFHVELNVYDWKPLTRLARTKIRKESIGDDDTSSSCSTKSLLYPSSVQLSESDISPRPPFPLNYKGAKCVEDKSYNKLVEGKTGDHPTRQWRALIVDDSKLNVKMAKRVLSTHFDELLEVCKVTLFIIMVCSPSLYVCEN